MSLELPPAQAWLTILQDWLGGTPLATYIVLGLSTWIATTIGVLTIRHAIEAHWQATKEWLDKVLVVVIGPDATKPDRLEYAKVHALQVTRGRVILDWTDDLRTIQNHNRQVIQVVNHGLFLMRTTRALYGGRAIIAAGVLTLVLVGLLMFASLDHLQDVAYKPLNVFWLSLLEIWPFALLSVQMALLPNWRKMQQEIERGDAHLRITYGFVANT